MKEKPHFNWSFGFL